MKIHTFCTYLERKLKEEARNTKMDTWYEHILKDVGIGSRTHTEMVNRKIEFMAAYVFDQLSAQNNPIIGLHKNVSIALEDTKTNIKIYTLFETDNLALKYGCCAFWSSERQCRWNSDYYSLGLWHGTLESQQKAINGTSHNNIKFKIFDMTST